MANKLKVDELRAKLAERGLSTTGLKAVLVERLEEAIAEAEKKEELKGKRKRNRDYSDGDEESNKLIAIGELRGMNVKELREESNKRGLATTGTKKELLERLCNDANNDSNSQVKPGTYGAEDDDTNGFEEEKKEEKIVTATKKGAAVLDQWIPDHIKSQYHVLQRAWSALGGCVFCISGAEAMFADLGHFSVRSIQVKLTWAAYLTNKASLPGPFMAILCRKKKNNFKEPHIGFCNVEVKIMKFLENLYT